MTRRCLAAIMAMASLSAYAQQPQTRWHEYTAKFKVPKHPVEVKVASYLGGEGTEWLCGASFLPDGVLVLAGTALGPDLSVGGIKATVLGADGAVPTVNSADAKAIESLDWSRTDGAPFLAWLDPDMKKAQRVIRLPWGVGSACGMAIDAAGGIYVAGKAGATIKAVGYIVDVTAEGAEKGNGDVFVLKLSSDGGKILWARTFADPGKGIRIRQHRGNILVEGEWGYVFDAEGKTTRTIKSGKTKGTKSILPVDWTVASGWDSNTRTGREPWRKPTLRVQFAEESKQDAKSLFPWDPKLVGTDKYRLVSDSSIRSIYFDDDGRMFVVGWSDGGNTVFDRQPLDLDKPVNKPGLGFSTWGAGVGSFAHIMQIDTKTMETSNKTLWSGYLTGKNKPAGGSVELLSIATDGSVLLTGSMGYGLIQTGDNLSPEQGNAGGPFVSILEPDMMSIRFSSAFLACGKVRLHTGNNWAPHWGITAQTVKGRHMAVFVSGAVKEEQRPMGMVPAPAKNALQKEYGGGLADGYITVMDLGPATAK